MSCLCPTYRRQRLLANALACFLAQDYPAERRELVILDDAGDFRHCSGLGWRLASTTRRLPSITAKFNTLADMASGDVLAVWEDDDIYLPWHLSAIAAAVQAGGTFAKPSRVLSLYTGSLCEEPAAGRFHGSIAMTRQALSRVGDWGTTRRADFDQQLIQRLHRLGQTADPCDFALPSYVFRYGSTAAYHGQQFMRSPDDEEWYDRAAVAPGRGEEILQPLMDAETAALMRQG